MDRGASEDGLLVTVLLQSFQLTHVAFLLNSCATCNQMERKQQNFQNGLLELGYPPQRKLFLICISQAVCHFFCEYLIILAQRGKNRSGD